MNNVCPICGFAEMPDPVELGNICPCCGTEFGYDDDLGVSYDEIRRRWIAQGMQWFSRAMPAPANWNPAAQVSRLVGWSAAISFNSAQQITSTSNFDVVVVYNTRAPRTVNILGDAVMRRRALVTDNSTQFVQRQHKGYKKPHAVVSLDHLVAQVVDA